MTKARLEAFSDGVLAIIITIMVLELPRPSETEAITWQLIHEKALLPIGMYLLSFVLIGIYWNNHHHLMHAVDRINGAVLWANLHLLFWLSLVPYLTDLMSHDGDHKIPAALYGIVLLLAGTAYRILVTALLRAHNPRLKAALGSDKKGWASIAIYAVAVAVAWWLPSLSIALYALVAIIWLVPDRRIERHVTHPSA